MKKRLIFLVGAIIAVIICLSAITVFAATDETPSLTVKSNTLELQNAVFMNFKVSAANVDDKSAVKLLVWEEAPAEFTKETAQLSLSSIRTEESTGYLVFQYDDLAAKDMTKFIYVRAYVNSNGEDVYSKTVKFSIVQYAYNQLNSNSTGEYLRGILENMLEYGAFSQLYFDHNTDFLATDEIAKIKVVNGTHFDGFKTGYFKAGTGVTVTADDAEEGYEFSHWTNSVGANVGTDSTLVIPECASDTYTAVYIKGSKGLEFTSNGDGTCYVSGIGTCSDTDVVIPSVSPDGDCVTSIGYEAFYNCRSLTSVTIGNSVTGIGNYAFSDCASLTSVTIPDSVTSIGDWVFEDCTSLTSIEIPDSVTSIGYAALLGCTSLTSINVDDENVYYKSVDGNLYSEDEKKLIQYAIGKTATSFVIPSGVTNIGNYAFRDCTTLTNVTIPDSVTSIGDLAFGYCTSLMSATIPDSVTSIGYFAFVDCTSLTSINVDDENAYYKSVDGNLYSEDEKTLIQYAVGKTATSFVVPSGVTSISDYAFENCASITSVTIPDCVMSIGDYAFFGCVSLATVNYTESQEDWEKISMGYYNDPLINATINYCYGSSKGLEFTSNGDGTCYVSGMGTCSDTYVVIPSASPSGDRVTSIGEYAFDYCKTLKRVTLPDSVTSIHRYAFFYCTSLTSVTIPDSVTYIGTYAFNVCISLTTVKYTGSQEDWDNIRIGSNNTPLTDATIKYNYQKN